MKKRGFLENARLLSGALGIVPLLYGSLGLEYVTGEDLNAEDIDILIPEVFLSRQWEAFRGVLEDNGYTLIDLHEHTFHKNGIHYSYARIEELEAFAGIPVSHITACREADVCFLLLSLEQYQQVYTASAQDGYRIHTRGKKDAQKLALIGKLLSGTP